MEVFYNSGIDQQICHSKTIRQVQTLRLAGGKGLYLQKRSIVPVAFAGEVFQDKNTHKFQEKGAFWRST